MRTDDNRRNMMRQEIIHNAPILQNVIDLELGDINREQTYRDLVIDLKGFINGTHTIEDDTETLVSSDDEEKSENLETSRQNQPQVVDPHRNPTEDARLAEQIRTILFRKYEFIHRLLLSFYFFILIITFLFILFSMFPEKIYSSFTNMKEDNIYIDGTSQIITIIIGVFVFFIELIMTIYLLRNSRRMINENVLNFIHPDFIEYLNANSLLPGSMLAEFPMNNIINLDNDPPDHFTNDPRFKWIWDKLRASEQRRLEQLPEEAQILPQDNTRNPGFDNILDTNIPPAEVPQDVRRNITSIYNHIIRLLSSIRTNNNNTVIPVLLDEDIGPET